MKFLKVLLFLALPFLAAAQNMKVIDGYLAPAGFTRITSLSSAVSLGTIPANTKLVLIQAETKDIRWRDDGTDPTASVGNLLVANSVFAYNGNASALKIIETSATATVNVSFYK